MTTRNANHYTAPKFVYFIKPIGMGVPIKIGSSWGPVNRNKTLSRGSPFPLEIIGTVRGTRKDELFLYRCFADCHSHGEWFHSTPALLEIISKILASNSMELAYATLIPKGKIPKPHYVAPREVRDERRAVR